MRGADLLDPWVAAPQVVPRNPLNVLPARTRTIFEAIQARSPHQSMTTLAAILGLSRQSLYVHQRRAQAMLAQAALFGALRRASHPLVS